MFPEFLSELPLGDEPLASGNFGEAWLVEVDGKSYIIKRFRDCDQADEEREVELSRDILHRCGEHDNLVLFHRTVEDDRDDCKSKLREALVLEFCQRGDLGDFIKNRVKNGEGFLTREDAALCFLHLLSGLQCLHRQDFVHRDIAPRNVFVSENAQGQLVLKIGDYGTAKRTDVSKGLVAKTWIKCTLHQAPEVDDSAEYDGRADVYSVGVLMYELLSLEVLDIIPETDEELDAQRARVATRLELAGSDLRKRYGDALVDLVLKCVAVNPLVSPSDGVVLCGSASVCCLLCPRLMVGLIVGLRSPCFLVLFCVC